tara:strand:+ start:352 stop:579 length:228 start_codon:yes stop_codon:yes gene_type:complete
MNTKEFNKRVELQKKELLQGNSDELLSLLTYQHKYRNYGIEGISFDKILTEIAQAKVLNIDLIADVNLKQWITQL